MCGYGEDPTVFWLGNPVARKEHKCCECLSVISPGERYELAKGVWGGEFDTFKTCSICKAVRDEANSHLQYDEKIPFECLWETVGAEYEDAV